MNRFYTLVAVLTHLALISTHGKALEVNENLIECRDTLNGKPTGCIIKGGTFTARYDYEMEFKVSYTNTCYRGIPIRAGFVINGSRHHLEDESGTKQLTVVSKGPIEFIDFDPPWNYQIFVRKDCVIKVDSIDIDLSYSAKALLEEKTRFLEKNIEALTSAKSLSSLASVLVSQIASLNPKLLSTLLEQVYNTSITIRDAYYKAEEQDTESDAQYDAIDDILDNFRRVILSNPELRVNCSWLADRPEESKPLSEKPVSEDIAEVLDKLAGTADELAHKVSRISSDLYIEASALNALQARDLAKGYQERLDRLIERNKV